MSRAGICGAPRSRERAGAVAAVATVLFVGALLGFGPLGAGESPDPFAALDLIRPRELVSAGAFRAAGSDGGPVSLADHDGEVVLVNFWATWCRPCQDEMPALERLYRRYRGQGFTVLAISLDASVALVPPFVRTHGLTFPVAVDPRMAVAQQYGVRALPATFLVDRRGQVRGTALGPRDWDSEPAHGVIEALMAPSLAPTGPHGASPRTR